MEPHERAAFRGVADLVMFQLKIIFWVLRFFYRLALGIFMVRKEAQLEKSLATPQRLTIPPERRFAHTHIVAGSGHGKTQAIQHMIAALDWEALKKGERTVIVMDSQGDMIQTILHQAELSPSHPDSIAKRLVYIDPTDTDNPPCLNVGSDD